MREFVPIESRNNLRRGELFLVSFRVIHPRSLVRCSIKNWRFLLQSRFNLEFSRQFLRSNDFSNVSDNHYMFLKNRFTKLI